MTHEAAPLMGGESFQQAQEKQAVISQDWHLQSRGWGRKMNFIVFIYPILKDCSKEWIGTSEKEINVSVSQLKQWNMYCKPVPSSHRGFLILTQPNKDVLKLEPGEGLEQNKPLASKSEKEVGRQRVAVFKVPLKQYSFRIQLSVYSAILMKTQSLIFKVIGCQHNEN